MQEESGEHIFHFNKRIRSQRVDVDTLHLSGSQFDPSVFNTHELISETVDTVKIDGKLQVKDATLSSNGGVLEVDKTLKAPDLIVGSGVLSEHISMLASSTRLLQNTEISGE